MNSTPRFRLMSGCGIGTGIHRDKAREKASVGARMNIGFDDVSGRRGSLMNSLIASAIGWSRPYGPTMFGPLRSCM